MSPSPKPAGKRSKDDAHETHEDGKPDKRKRSTADPMDPTVRQMAALAPPLPAVTAVSAAAAPDAPRSRMSMEELLPSLVKRIAWAGDRNQGSVRLELGAGRFAGTTLVVHAEGSKVRVEVSGADADELRPLLDERLRRSGLDVESVT